MHAISQFAKSMTLGPLLFTHPSGGCSRATGLRRVSSVQYLFMVIQESIRLLPLAPRAFLLFVIRNAGVKKGWFAISPFALTQASKPALMAKCFINDGVT
jgi:hypothetical protein